MPTRPPSTAILISAYNEEQRIKNTLTQVVKIVGIEQIVCVDDGSQDSTREKIQEFVHEHPAKITPIFLEQNTGKSAAILAGLENISQDYTLLCDADLYNIEPTEFARSIKQLHPEIDMIVLRRVHSVLFPRIFMGDMLLTGERVVRTTELKKVFSEFGPTGYQIEMAINTYMRQHNKSVVWTPISANSVWKFRKRSFFTGLWGELQMYFDLWVRIGFVEYLRQFLWARRLQMLKK